MAFAESWAVKVKHNGPGRYDGAGRFFYGTGPTRKIDVGLRIVRHLNILEQYYVGARCGHGDGH